MSTADIVIICLILLPAIIGIIYGFLSIFFSLLSWVISLGLAIRLVPYVSPLLEGHIDQLVLRIMLAFIGLFILSLLIMSSISYLMVKLSDRSGLTVANRIFGLFFGMSLGGVIVTVIVFIAGFTVFPQVLWWQESKLVKPFELVSIWGVQFLPGSFIQYHSYEIK